MLRFKVLVSALVLFCVWAVLPVSAVRRPDVPNSRNGELPPSTCPDSVATPFFAQLDGTQSPPAGCSKTGEPHDPNHPNPPAVYPNLSVTLSGSGFTITVTPALWDLGAGTSSNAASKHTVFRVQFSGQAGMTLQTLLIGSKLDGASYVPCDPTSGGRGIPYCVADPLMLDQFQNPWALEPAPIDQADTTTTRWDFSQFTAGSDDLFLMVNGFPSEFSGIDIHANSNALTAASFVATNFLAIVTDASNNVLTAGGLAVPKKAPAATNDLFVNAIKITKVPFKSFLDTSATNPTEILSGTGAGGEIDPQGDPTPQDPAVVSAGTGCATSWPSGANVFRSVWYAFTPSVSQNYAISTAGSRYDTGVYVFTGSTSAPSTVACNDDSPSTGVGLESSYVNFGAVAGTTYYVMVSEVPPVVGTDLSGTTPLAAPLANDATLDFSLSVGSPVILFPNTSHDFGNQPIKTTSNPLTITATNTTSTSVTVARVSIYGSGTNVFHQTNTCGTTIGPGAECTISVTFTPLVKGLHVADLQLQFSGGAVFPTPLVLMGTGD